MGWVLFFDGECGFCSVSVRRVARLDRRGVVSFAPLQGELAAEHGFARYAEGGGTMVLLRESDGRVFLRSDAVLELCRALGGPWRLLLIGRLVPRPLRDAAYRWIASRRRGFGGRTPSCDLPDPDLAKRLKP